MVNLNEKVDSLMEEVDRLTGALFEARDKTISFYDFEKRCFRPIVHKCVWDLVSKHVSFSNVSEVIGIVLNMCGIKL